MVRALLFFRDTLQGRLLTISVFPLVIVTAALTVNTLNDDRYNVELEYRGVGLAAVEHLAATSDFALYSGNRQLLETIVRSLTQLDEVDGVAFLNARREVQVSSLNDPPWSVLLSGALEGGTLHFERKLYFERPVTVTGLEVDDFRQIQGENNELLGWVLVAIDVSAIAAERSAILARNIGAAAGLLTLAILSTYFLSSSLVRSIQGLSSTVKKLEDGKLSVRAGIPRMRELGALGEGINYLAKSIAQSKQSLEGRVQSATYRLQLSLDDLRKKNEELEQARRHAEAANRAKSEFLARMSHELRTPLNAIQGFVRLLEKSELEQAQRRHCQIIEQAAGQLLLLIEDILEYARLQSQGVSLDAKPLDIVACVEQPIRLLALPAHEKDVDVIYHVDPDLPVLVVGDSLRIRQIVSNLLGNAIKFTDSGQVIVRLYARQVCTEKLVLVIEVRDTGIGMSPEQTRQVVGAFSQGDTSITRRYGGTGLGLSIVNMLAELMDGGLQIDSTPGMGSTVRVSLSLGRQQGVKTLKKFNTPLAIFDPNTTSRRALLDATSRLSDRVRGFATLEALIEALTDTDFKVIAVSLGLSADRRRWYDTLARLRSCTEAPIFVFIPLKWISEGGLDSSVLNEIGAVGVLARPWAVADFFAVYKAIRDGRIDTVGKAAQLPGLRVLAAEDNRFTRELLTTILEGEGCQLQLVANGQIALEAAAKHRYDILLFDVHMPELNGVDALTRVRAGEAGDINRFTPAVLLTADVLQPKEALRELHGSNVIMLKPFEGWRLIKQLQDLSGRRETADANPAANGQPVPHMAANPRVPLSRFVDEVGGLLAQARAAHERGQKEELREAIHQLIGIAGVFKFAELETCAQRLHGAAKGGGDGVPQALLAAVEALQRVRETSPGEFNRSS